MLCYHVCSFRYAEYCTAPISQCLVSPSFLTDIQAASLPETFFTVYSNLVDRGALAAGQCVLIHGGTSGIGVAAIQMSRALGAHCVVTVQNSMEIL
jgi:NADPH2:quinone reductase